ncbi:TVP38/TMEM64 family protein [Methylomarinum vadi]|uniref:TVP38/TMEM64 family protein n=1 Tax=Methylomarinum vadi TaxID=438855 RepID=UPI0004DEDEA7|nr:VTT domain-containing protein [Methylomarinum vadi]
MTTKTMMLWRKLMLAVALAAGLIFLSHELKLHLPAIEQWVLGLGYWAPLGFIVLFALLTPLLVSVDALCFAAGLLFSLAAAEFYMILATYLAATVIFLLARHLFKRKVESFIAQRRKLYDLNGSLQQHAFRLMLLLRLTPLPFALLSYAFAVGPVRFWPYLAATSGILVYNGTLVYLGYATKHLAGLISGDNTHVAIPHSLLIAGLLATFAILFYVSKLAGNTLKELSGKK